jgi:asparagine synthase (glutamine-hydrolysing)
MDWLNDLERLFDEAVKATCEPKCAVILSSGVDSALVAYAAAKHSEVTGYHVGVTGCEDTKYAKRITGTAPFRIEHIELSIEDVESAIPRVLAIWPQPDPIDVGVAIPFFSASKAASNDKQTITLCGQGGDELFGGYWRYLECIVDKGPGAVAALMEKDWAGAYRDNLDRDIAVNKANGCELRFPYLGKGFSDYVRGMPMDLKIRENGDLSCDEIRGRRFVRKYALKKLAVRMGVPDYIADRVKKAAQYGSGTSKALDKLAKIGGFRDKASSAGRTDYVRMYLEDVLHEI